MRAMRADGELHLQPQLVGIYILSIAGVAKLTTKLGKFTGPVGQHQRPALVGEIGLTGAVAPIETSAKKPTARKLIVGRAVKAEGALLRRKLLALAPNELAARNERVIDGTLQRLPAQRGIHTVETADEIL